MSDERQDMNARIREAGRRRSHLGFVDGRLARIDPRKQEETGERDEAGRFVGSADGGARGPELEAPSPTMSDLIRGHFLAREHEDDAWTRFAQRVRTR